MKKLVSTILALGVILSTFTACKSTTQEEKAIIPVTKYTTEGKTNELVPDETATGELVISDYISDWQKPKYDVMEKMYNELYPNVKLTIDLTIYEENLTPRMYADKMATEIMSGKGPDIFLTTNQDVHKMMKSGALADLTPYFENDKTFDVSKYNENVLYGTQFQGKQYVVPTGYTFPLIYEYIEVDNNTGFDVDKCVDYYSTMEQLLPIVKEYGFFSHGYKLSEMAAIYDGLDIFDYENNKVNLADNVTLKNNFKIAKEVGELYETQENRTAFNLQYNESLNGIIGLGQNKTIIDAKEAVIVPIKNFNGKITAETQDLYAVNANSKNTQNAYNFIKMIIHPDFLVEAYAPETSPHITDIPLSNEFIEYEMARYLTKNRTEYTDKYEKDFYDMLDSIDEVNMYYDINVIFLGEIMPQYFNDEATLDECLEEAQTRLEIYISE